MLAGVYFVMFSQRARFPIPQGIEVAYGQEGLRFKGSAAALLRLSENLRALSVMPDGTRRYLPDGWILGVFSSWPLLASEKLIAMPSNAWNIAASKFAEVAAGWEETPFDFSDCGFLWPPPKPNIGVERIGPPIL